MSVFSVNLSSRSKSQGGIALADGKYTMEVVQAFEGKSSVKGSPQINVILEVIESEDNGKDFWGAQAREYLPLTEKTAFRRADFAWACGYEGEEGEDTPVDIDTDEIARLDEDGEVINEQGAILQVTRKTVTDTTSPSGKRVRLYFNRRPAPTAPVVAKVKVKKAPARRIVQ